MRWLDSITDSMDMGLGRLRESKLSDKGGKKIGIHAGAGIFKLDI